MNNQLQNQVIKTIRINSTLELPSNYFFQMKETSIKSEATHEMQIAAAAIESSNYFT